MDDAAASQGPRTDSPDPSSHAFSILDQLESEGDVDELDDDDMDFEPTSDDSGDVEFLDVEADSEEFHDAEDGLSGVDIEFSIEEGDDGTAEAEGTATAAGSGRETSNVPATRHRIQVPNSQLLRLLGHAGFRRIFANHSDATALDDDDDDDGAYGVGRRSRRRAKPAEFDFGPVPSEEGTKLMRSGTFGCTDYSQHRLKKRNRRLATRLMDRELGTERGHPTSQDKMLSQGLIPSSRADSIIHYNARCYSGQFSDDGNFFFSCAQDFKVRMYDTSNPYSWKYYKTAVYPYGQWTITDASLSPDNKLLAYSSIRPTVCLAPTDPGESGEPWMLDFSDMTPGTSRQRTIRGTYRNFGIWSIRFSGDGREIVAGTSDRSVLVYDIDTRQTILRIEGHGNDVNAVCFGDTSSPHILYSGSDDTLIKVWDRRSMGDSREAGVFMGHTEGLTYVDSKGDGRYVLSNGKDQTMKLWDLRKMMSPEKASAINPTTYTQGFDYRFMNYSPENYKPHPHDCSLVTYRGHSVLKTLIRCHFSPQGSTNSSYVYSGSEDGGVYVYNIDGTLASKLDVNETTKNSRPRDPDAYANPYGYDDDDEGSAAWKTCVRDASWHPTAPVIAATSWNGWGMSTGTCTIHSWNDGASDDEGDPEMGQRVTQTLERDDRLYGRQGSRSTRRRSGLRSRRVTVFADDDDDQEADAW